MLVGSTVNRVAIIGSARIPFARAMGAYAQYSNQDMLTATLKGLVERYHLQGMTLGEVAAGAVLKHTRDFNLTREAVLSSGLAPETPAYDLQQACGTSLETALRSAPRSHWDKSKRVLPQAWIHPVISRLSIHAATSNCC